MVIQLILGFLLASRWRAWARRWRARRRCASAWSTGPTAAEEPHRAGAYLGGLAVFTSFLLSLGMIFDFDHELLALVLASTIVTAVGLIDDFGVLTPKPKMLGQIVAVFVLLKAGVILQLVFLPWWARYAITIVWLLGLSNAFNLLDIMDGLASGVGFIAGSFLLWWRCSTGAGWWPPSRSPCSARWSASCATTSRRRASTSATAAACLSVSRWARWR
jgi:UDP-GlcNAc:undecaprenyl-phosphate GlcNAc-1-phosphate transferase